MKKNIAYETLEDIKSSIKKRKKFNYYVCNDQNICVIHIKFGDLRKCYLNLCYIKDDFFVNEYSKYFSYEDSFFKNPIDILNYIKNKKLPIILFNNYTSTEVTIDDAYNYVMGNQLNGRK